SSTSSTSSSYSLSFFFSRYGDPRHLHSFPTRRSSDLKNLAQVRFLSRAFFPICDEHGGISHLHSNGKNRCRMPFRRMADGRGMEDRKSTRLNSSHVKISYAVFCLKKKKKKEVKYRYLT